MARFAKDYRELEVYRQANAVALRSFELSRAFPKEESYELTSQLRRSTRSIGAQIAEAWGKRRYPRHFTAKLTDADAEQLEARHWIGIAVECGYLDEESARDLLLQLTEIGLMLNSMLAKPARFRVR